MDNSKEYKKHLRQLVAAVKYYIKVMDEEMKKPQSYERGKMISILVNELQLANDQARHFGLGEKLKGR